MTVALIGLFASLAVCALIGWGFIRLLGATARRLRGNRPTLTQQPTEPSILFRSRIVEEPEDVAQGTTDPAPQRDIETYFEKGRWKNKVQGSSRAAHVHANKADALKVGRDMARKRQAEHIIKNKDGTIGEQDTQRDDPRSEAG